MGVRSGTAQPRGPKGRSLLTSPARDHQGRTMATRAVGPLYGACGAGVPISQSHQSGGRWAVIAMCTTVWSKAVTSAARPRNGWLHFPKTMMPNQTGLARRYPRLTRPTWLLRTLAQARLIPPWEAIDLVAGGHVRTCRIGRGSLRWGQRRRCDHASGPETSP